MGKLKALPRPAQVRGEKLGGRRMRMAGHLMRHPVGTLHGNSKRGAPLINYVELLKTDTGLDNVLRSGQLWRIVRIGEEGLAEFVKVIIKELKQSGYETSLEVSYHIKQ